MQTFFCDEEHAVYRELMAQWCTRCQVGVWAYCLMPKHVHFVAHKIALKGESMRKKKTLNNAKPKG